MSSAGHGMILNVKFYFYFSKSYSLKIFFFYFREGGREKVRAEAQVLGVFPVAFLDELAGSWIRWLAVGPRTNSLALDAGVASTCCTWMLVPKMLLQ